MELKYDKKIQIATGRSRKEVHWKNQDIFWSQLVEKLSQTHRTAEVQATYLAAGKSRRDEIKDIGGFVTGYLPNGKRRAGNVIGKSVITLDADNAKADIWETVCLLYNNAALLYSTHSSTPDKFRCRILFPLSREIAVDEYEPIARKLAASIGIDQFDDTTYQPERLMYWPSTSKDAIYAFEYQDGPFLDADELLGSYRDWRDISEWPLSSRQHDVIRREIKKQQDPTEKPGIIGAFCRTYGITDAIDMFLTDIYEECDISGRYTYKMGSTSAGVVVYEDKYAFSHHGTDPASGKLCNAFDLVRIHLFGLKDEDSTAKGNALPSYQAMIDLAVADKEVKKTLASEKWRDAVEEFSGVGEQPDIEAADTDWMAELEADRKGRYLSTVFNAKYIIENDPRLKGRIALNTFSGKTDVLKPLPWDKTGFKQPRGWEDRDQSIIENYLSLAPYELNMSGVKVKNILEEVKLTNAYHPIRKYLNNLSWDKVERIESLFIDYLGVQDSAYTRTITKKMLVAAVKRVFEPGCKFDNVVTLVGKGGIGKSTIYRKLGRKWFSDTFNFNMLTRGDGKPAYEQLQGAWITEIPEMTGLRKADDEAIKSFLASGTDTYRASYGRETASRKRQGIFVGTSNDDEFIRSGRADRRWWPLACGVQEATKNVWEDLTDAEIDQIWAEAIVLYRAGETLFLSKEMEATAAEVRKGFVESEPWEEVIREYLDKLLPTNWGDLNIYQRREFLDSREEKELYPSGTVQRDRVSIKEIWEEAIHGKFDQLTNESRRKIKNLMDNNPDWEKAKGTLKIFGVAARGWFRRNLGLFSAIDEIQNKDENAPF